MGCPPITGPMPSCFARPRVISLFIQRNGVAGEVICGFRKLLEKVGLPGRLGALPVYPMGRLKPERVT